MNKSVKLINIDDEFDFAVEEIVNHYSNGKVFIYPTDTIYGIGGNPFIKEVVELINNIKSRNTQKQYIYLIDSVETLMNFVEVKSEQQIDFLRKIWPNPVSIVLNLKQNISKKLKFDTAAFRIPDNKFCQLFLSKLKQPVISTSVNIMGTAPSNDYSEIKQKFFNSVSAIFFSNQKTEISQSTLIELTSGKPKLLRQGKINFVELMNIFG